jgi:hypothetical protein
MVASLGPEPMPIPPRPPRALTILAGALCSILAMSASAQPPVYKDAERAGAAGPVLRPTPEVMVEVERQCCVGSAPGYHRPVNRGPGYAGSVRGLGRPSYDGLSPAPGYGSYRELPTD